MSIPYVKQRHNQRHGIINAHPSAADVQPLPPPRSSGVKPQPQGRADGAPPAAARAMPLRAAPAVLLLLLCLATVQADVNMELGFEGFETYAPVTETPNADWYTYSTTNINALVSISEAFTGTKSLRMAPNAASGQVNFENVGGGFDWCEEDGVVIYLKRTANIDSSTITGAARQSAAGTQLGPTSLFSIDSAGDVTFNSVLVGGMVADTWYDFRMFFDLSTATEAGACDGAFSSSTCFSSVAFNFNQCSNLLARTENGVYDTFTISFNDAAAPFAGEYWLDTMNFGVDAPIPGTHFCADAGEEDNFGWDYVEGVQFMTTGVELDDDTSISMADYYRFAGQSDNSDYTAKAFNPGSKAFQTVFTIEAADDGLVSIFRVAYTKGATTLTAGEAGDSGVDMAAASDGEDGGNFDDAIQVRFVEEGGDWRITLRQNIGGTGLVQIPGVPSVAFGNPNVQNSYVFRIDSRGTGGPIASVFPFGGNATDSIIQAETGFSSGTIWKDQWFIGKGNIATLDSVTALDNNDSGDTTPSTCIYDLVGTSVVVGSPGSQPNNETVDDPTDDGGDDGAGGTGAEKLISNPYFYILIWILLINVIIAALSWATRAGFGGMVYGIASFVVYIFGFLFYDDPSVVSIWPIVATVSLAIGLAIWGFVRR